MKALTRDTVNIPTNLPIKVLQFGEGNFLRAFVDWAIDVLNEKKQFNAGVAVVQPIEHGMVDMIQKQDGLYHHMVRGIQKGKRINDIRLNTSIQQLINPFNDFQSYMDQALNEDLQFIVSNTTEAGITFKEDDLPKANELAKTFPGKLTQLIKARYDHFSGSSGSGLIFIPCELIEKNGENLKKAILAYADLWKYESGFKDWLEDHCYFANTLVDRIVPGYPKDEINEIQQKIGYEDQLVVASEVFHLWVIEGPAEIKAAFPDGLEEIGLNIKFVKDLTPYRTQKVRILNGSHTAMVPVGILAGNETVRENVEDDVVGPFILQTMYDEIVQTINLPVNEVKQFADEVLERFKNPFIRHELKSIALNSVSKYKVRILPTVKDYYRINGTLPKRFIFALACLIELYLSDDFQINDDEDIEAYFEQLKANRPSNTDVASQVLSNKSFWGEDLTKLGDCKALVTNYMNEIKEKGVLTSIKSL
ncbi:MAG: tagaturonate reductase [Cyclobacteriaceae bacterium]